MECLMCKGELKTGKKYCSYRCYDVYKKTDEYRKSMSLSLKKSDYVATKEHREKLSKALKGNKKLIGNQNWKKRNHKKLKEFLQINNQRKEFKEKISKSITKLWENPEYRKHMVSKFKNKKSHRTNLSMLEEYGEKRTKEILSKFWKSAKLRPTSYEKTLKKIIKKNNLPYKYVGDGSFLIGYKNPDFVNVNGEKICIEVFESYFKNRTYGSVENYIQKRNSHFGKYGWRTIFIDEHELKDENILLKKIKEGGKN